LLDPAKPKEERRIDMLARHTAEPPSPLTQVVIAPGGGAVGRVPEDATAFSNRDAPFNIHYINVWADASDDERCIGWTRQIAADMKPHTTGGLYLNYIGDEGSAAFGDAKFERLQRIKAQYDPENLFRFNQNIPPAA
jgi:FAD/FMN-containing dehydrogenase